ncbi:hypothetical protein ECH_0586 [Ehrlichia chaffeensis str. Arkansas]|uniref:Uncharacterized protein n=1 Tax=Ehrlichia chaffeensis (strain ATCC CRL-10679 / Arkansas) TaxID=205920 RepID=Q2GGN6_EHRCR|nr:hypothetical protein ECH_0586 [Ehrlichia chaffeensis str. Arkansas]
MINSCYRCLLEFITKKKGFCSDEKGSSCRFPKNQ